MKNETKRIFFGLEVESLWPKTYPEGRLLEESHRHITLAFLGNVPFTTFENELIHLPLPACSVGLVGIFDKCLFLPKNHPRVVAWNVDWLDNPEVILSYQKTLVDWLSIKSDGRPFLPHVTLCRAPFVINDWKTHFQMLPMVTKSLHLYESVGELQYLPIWSYPITPPFQEISHTADLAFDIFGENLSQIWLHAQIALAFKFPELLPYLRRNNLHSTLDEIIIALNELITEVDQDIGCPFKAVSFHGKLKQIDTHIYHWELIIDV